MTVPSSVFASGVLAFGLAVVPAQAHAEVAAAPAGASDASVDPSQVAPASSMPVDAGPRLPSSEVEPSTEEAGDGRRSTGMMVAGIVLTSTGGAELLAGAVASILFAGQGGQGGGFGILLLGIPLMASGFVQASIGIPLAAVGASSPSEEQLARALRSVAPPSGLTLRFAF